MIFKSVNNLHFMTILSLVMYCFDFVAVLLAVNNEINLKFNFSFIFVAALLVVNVLFIFSLLAQVLAFLFLNLNSYLSIVTSKFLSRYIQVMFCFGTSAYLLAYYSQLIINGKFA